METRFFQGDKMIENETLRLDIEVLPAWWATPWFHLLAFLLLVVVDAGSGDGGIVFSRYVAPLSYMASV